ncbi:MAG: hypothetical protein B6244_02215 [Candidatus Cloacimonetes bacterium 4572_55]|nr:MAG: hypothetical protein B6244_02215 [Candidatus Cloacimonetes bacterium 4572_55]
MALTGNLTEFSLPDIVRTISNGKKSGILSIKGEVGVGLVYFQGGRVIQAISPLRREKIGESLMKKGLITRQQLEDALQTQEDRGRNQRIGSILLEKELISSELNEDSLRYQVEEAFYDLMEWVIGFYRFDPKSNFKNPGVILDVERLLHEGERRLKEKTNEVASVEIAEEPDDEVSAAMSRLIAVYGDELESALQELEIAAISHIPEDDDTDEEYFISIKEILDEFQEIDGVKLALIVGKNGTLHDCAGDPGDIHFTLSAMAGNSWGLLESLAEKVDADDALQQSFIQFSGCSFFIKAITEDRILLIVSEPEVSVQTLMSAYLAFRKQIRSAMNQVESL